MAIDFPSSPTNGQTFTSGSVTYTWDGTKWTAVAAAGSSNSISQGNTNATVTDTGSDGRFVVTTEGTERLRVDSSGRLGVGTANPSGLVHLSSVSPNLVLQGSAYPSVKFLNSGGTAVGELYYGVGGNDINITNYNAGPIGFIVNGSEHGRFDSSGRFLLGTTAGTGAKLDLNGAYAQNVTAVAALNIDCSLGNTFTKTINGASTFTVSSVPASRSYAFTLELTHTSGTITWFSGVVWPGGTAPTLTTGKVHLFMFFTDDGGTTWRASSLINY